MTNADYHYGRRIGMVLGLLGAIALGGMFALGWFLKPDPLDDGPVPPQEAPPAHLMGWGGKAAADAAYEEVKATLPKFDIQQASNADKRVILNGIARQVWGSDPPYYPQEIGDCVAFGAKHACQLLSAIREFETGEPQPRDWFPCYHYATGRNASYAGKGQIRGPDGSVGSWQAIACQRDGVIPSDAKVLEGLKYSGAVARQWAGRMPAERYLTEGRKFPVKTVAKVTTADQIRDANCNGYPVPCASDWGGLMRCPVQHGRIINRKAGTWQHQMCVIGYDGRPETVRQFGEPLFLIWNNWGDAHGIPTDGTPRGSFWVRRREIDYIARQDCWAYSDLNGFVERDLTAHRVRAPAKEPAANVGHIALAN